MLHYDVRPQTWGELVGHTPVVKSIERMREKGDLGGKAFWLNGKSGIGKTTIAYLIAGDVCDPENFLELDAGDITPAKLDEIERRLQYTCIGVKQGRAVLINEAHGLRKDTIRKLLVVLERIPKHVTWVFTTTLEGQQLLLDGIDSHPLTSRCLVYTLRSNSKVFADHVKGIAEREGLGGASLQDFIDLAKRCNNNMREMLSCVETGEMMREEAFCV